MRDVRCSAWVWFCALLLPMLCAIHPCGAVERSVPRAPAAVIFLRYDSLEYLQSYEHDSLLRKMLVPEGYMGFDDICYYDRDMGDWDTLTVRSLLTGELELRVLREFPGYGQLIFPADSLLGHTIQHGHSNPDPLSLGIWNLQGSPEDAGRAAWNSVRDTDVVSRIVYSAGAYEVVVTDLCCLIDEPVWVIFVLGRPPAPPDLACVKVVWPRSLITRGVPTQPEVLVHNFGDEDLPCTVSLLAAAPWGQPVTGLCDLGVLPKDTSGRGVFSPLVPASIGAFDLSFRVLGPDGGPWKDDYPENDALSRSIRVIDEPVFRAVSSRRHPGTFPTDGEPLDFDGDHDVDIFLHGYNPKLLQNDGAGRFRDITGESPITFPHHPRLAVCRDFTGDGRPDLLVVFYGQAPLLLSGDGTGHFTDITQQAGLAGYTGYWEAEAVDLEGDGDEDLLLQTRTQDLVLENDGQGHFTNVTFSSGVVDPDDTQGITAGDLNGDGHPDLFLANWGGPSRSFVNDGDGTFHEFPGPWNALTYARTAIFVDHDRDGLQDIVLARWDGVDSTTIYRNTGGLVFQGHPPALPQAFRLDYGDVNADGWTDVLLGPLFAPLLFLNDRGNLVDRTDLLVDLADEVGGTEEAPRIIDLDGDGDLDLYTGSVILMNQGVLNLGPGHGSDRGVDRGIGGDIAGVVRSPSPSRLAQFPTPLSPGGTVSLTLPRSGPVKLIFYDVQGREVARIFDRPLSAGLHRLPWDPQVVGAKAVGSGLYFYSLDTTEGKERGRVLVIR